MKSNYKIIIGIFAIIIVLTVYLSMGFLKEKNLTMCKFPNQIGGYGTIDQPNINKGDNYKISSISYAGVGMHHGVIDIKIKIFENEGDAQQEFINTNFYDSQDCQVFDGRSNCLVPDGKSTSDRSCSISGVSGRCVNIVDPNSGGWIIEFEWLEKKEIKSVELTYNEQLEKSEKFRILEQFVDNFKNCI